MAIAGGMAVSWTGNGAPCSHREGRRESQGLWLCRDSGGMSRLLHLVAMLLVPPWAWFSSHLKGKATVFGHLELLCDQP